MKIAVFFLGFWVLLQARPAPDFDSLTALEAVLDSLVSRVRDPEAHWLLARYNEKKGRLAEAEMEYQKTLFLNPGHERAKGGLALIARRLGDYATALALLKEKAGGPDFFYSFRAADLYERSGKSDSAAHYFELSLSKNPYNRAAYLRLAGLWSRAGRGARALATLDRAGQFFPEDPEAEFLRGEALLAEGDPATAFGFLESACAAVPDSARWRLALARAYEKEKRWGGAHRLYRTLVQGDSGGAEAREGIRRTSAKIYPAGVGRAIIEKKVEALRQKPERTAADFLAMGESFQRLHRPDSARRYFALALCDSLRAEVFRALSPALAETLSPVHHLSKLIGYRPWDSLPLIVSAHRDRNGNGRIDFTDGFTWTNRSGDTSAFRAVVPWNRQFTEDFFFGYLPSGGGGLLEDFARALYTVGPRGAPVKVLDLNDWTFGFSREDTGSFLLAKVEEDVNGNGGLDYFDGFYLYRFRQGIAGRLTTKPLSGVMKSAIALDERRFLLLRYGLRKGKNIEWIGDSLVLSLVDREGREKVLLKNLPENGAFLTHGGRVIFAGGAGLFRFVGGRMRRIFKGPVESARLLASAQGFYFATLAGELHFCPWEKDAFRQIPAAAQRIHPLCFVTGRGLYYAGHEEDTDLDGEVTAEDFRALYLLEENGKSGRLTPFFLTDDPLVVDSGSAMLAVVKGAGTTAGVVRVPLAAPADFDARVKGWR